ncbi:hypothetical protein SCLCIDRAFT_1224392 [Scleroderma citrinum Foug A]|uniref:Uncharacterized protein n=1 Tax=Scleroderma citrinum Foug A TaxID=1036808 RepID=A0A0C3D566_9AGAM|nr:hypothetical protein SCLCIDRAFT_1224392 [Scleroderma citrinum Foug A]
MNQHLRRIRNSGIEGITGSSGQGAFAVLLQASLSVLISRDKFLVTVPVPVYDGCRWPVSCNLTTLALRLPHFLDHRPPIIHPTVKISATEGDGDLYIIPFPFPSRSPAPFH